MTINHFHGGKLAIDRILIIVKFLTDGKEVNVKELAVLFDVTTRTIRRDIQNISKVFDISRKKGYYKINKGENIDRL